MFKIGDQLVYIPKDTFVEVEGVDRDFISVVDSAGEAHVVVKEDFNKYKKVTA